MRAAQASKFGGPEVLQYLTNVKIPEIGPSQVLIKVYAAGVNPVDTYLRSGVYPKLPPLPFIPGKDAGGIVHKVGDKVKSFKEGDRVFTFTLTNGTYAEYTLCKESYVHHLPDSLSFKEGASLGTPYFTASRALFHVAKAKPTESVLIHGASGGVGLAAVQITRAKDMVVLGTAGTEEGMALVKKAGAHHVFNHRSPNYCQEIMDVTGKIGVNIILEMLANVNLDKDLDLVARNGRICVVGNRGSVEVDPRKTMGKESSVMGVNLAHSSDDEMKEYAQIVQEGAEKGWLKPIIGVQYKLEEASLAHHEIIHTKGARGKMILTVVEE